MAPSISTALKISTKVNNELHRSIMTISQGLPKSMRVLDRKLKNKLEWPKLGNHQIA